MRFTKLTYLHTDEFEDIKEIKFAGDFKDDVEDVLTVEVWVQDGHTNVVIMDNMTNEIIPPTDKEEEFALGFARGHGFIQ